LPSPFLLPAAFKKHLPTADAKHLKLAAAGIGNKPDRLVCIAYPRIFLKNPI
jgi:hypothetical protein